MSFYIDQLFINRVGLHLDRFKKRNDSTWNFRCPICNDSNKNKAKTRGYIYKKKGQYHFYCHNCSLPLTFRAFLKRVDHSLYQEYQLAKMEESGMKIPETLAKKEEFNREVTINLPTLKKLSVNHTARKFITERKIPVQWLDGLYFASNFKEFIDEVYPDHGKEFLPSDRRIIIPFRDGNGRIEGVQGRALDKSDAKYITININPESKKLFGLDRVNFNKTVYVVEGPFDSLFVENSIATMDSSLWRVVEKIGNRHEYVFIYDNEKLNRQIVSNLKKTINLGYSVFIWPKRLSHYKDINEAVLGGYSPSELMDIIRKNTFTDLKAKLELTAWQK